MKLNHLIIILAVCLSLPFIACGQENQSNSNQSQISEIPSGVENSTYDDDVNKETVLVIKVDDDNKIYLRKSGLSEFKDGKIINYFNYVPLTDANLSGEIWNVLRDKTPDRRLAYIQADANVKFGRLTELFEKMASSKAEPDKFRLLVNPLKKTEKSEQTESGGYVLNLILPPKIVAADNRELGGYGSGNGRKSESEPAPPPPPLPPGYKPNQKTEEEIAAAERAKQIEIKKAEARKNIKVEKLSVELDDTGKIKFNNKAQTLGEFSASLKKIFDERTAYDIFIDGTNEVNKMVYLKISPNVNYGGAIGLIDKIYGLGTNRLYLDGLQY